ncbi:MAG: response regulator [Eubacterium sp.]|nr:response regulator [Eubacterium sp.]
MKKILIAEDEKLIRAGIRTMIQRSGVEVEEIIETNNGEDAWDIIQNNKVDAVFTDIRMPKMNGIELVKHIHELDEAPFVVAISGYDDFGYAVEMLRNGVLEYLLKPVERQKIAEVVKLIETKLQAREKKTQREAYSKVMESGSYRIIMFYPGAPGLDEEENLKLTKLPEAGDGNFFVVKDEDFNQEDYTDFGGVGVSQIHSSEEELAIAYQEVRSARLAAFCRGGIICYEALDDKAEVDYEELLTDTARTRRIQLIGTDKQKEFLNEWDELFDRAASGRMPAEDFKNEISISLRTIPRIYKTLFDERGMQEILVKLEEILLCPDLDTYREHFMRFLLRLNEIWEKQDDAEPTKKKIGLAMEYIKENYAEDLNMAVVSNYISMNYTLFSINFKQYTGSNFVNYLKEIRLNAARNLLVETDEKIIDIARAVGYENYKHFLKSFRMEFGVSPTEYRKNMQREDF